MGSRCFYKKNLATTDNSYGDEYFVTSQFNEMKSNEPRETYEHESVGTTEQPKGDFPILHHCIVLQKAKAYAVIVFLHC